MNNLLIDIGNSRIKSRVVEENRVFDLAAFDHQQDQLAAMQRLKTVIEKLSSSEPVQSIHIASVPSEKQLDNWVNKGRQLFGAPVVLHQAQASGFGITNSYAEPCKLGIDRWLAMIAAYQLVKGAVCVIDCGSALTIDVIDVKGKHLGGFISPGRKMMVNSLLSGTGKITVDTHLADNDGDCFDQIGGVNFGKNTTQAVVRGSFYASLGLVRQCIVDIKSQLNDTCEIVLTGGDSASLLPYLDDSVRHVDGLVLDGLQLDVERLK